MQRAWKPFILALALSANAAAAPIRIEPDHRAIPDLVRKEVFERLPRGDLREVMAGQVMVKFSTERATRLQAIARSGIHVTAARVPFRAQYRSRIAQTGWTLWEIPRELNPATAASQFRRQPGVFHAQPVNRMYKLLPEPNDGDWDALESREDFIFSFTENPPTPFRRVWHLLDSFAMEGWSVYPGTWYTAATRPADSPLIAIIDTGADMTHPDFINAGGTSTDVSGGGQLVHALSRQFRFGEPYAAGTPHEVHGHGTHVAGIALAAGNNGSLGAHGTIGVGFNSRGMILRVFDEGGVGTDADAAAAIYFAANNGADIINLSLGTENFSQLLQDAVTYAFQRGSLVVAAGNQDGAGGGDLGPIYPAAASGAFGVTANSPAQPDFGIPPLPAITTYAGFGPHVDIGAPGGDVFVDPGLEFMAVQFVWSMAMTMPGTMHGMNLFPPYDLNYAYSAGTSMAAPSVAGAAGVFYGRFGLDQNSGWANVRAYQALQRSAMGVMGAPNWGWEPNQGYGALDLSALVQDQLNRPTTVGSVEGIVYSAEAVPQGFVEVRAQRVGSTATFSTTTFANGTYRFEQLPPGEYIITVSPRVNPLSKRVVIKLGADMPGFDFWRGNPTWDTTPPVAPLFSVVDHSSNSLTMRHWAYDTETGVDSMVFRVGRTAGGSDVMADRIVPMSGDRDVTFGGLDLTLPGTYHVQATYRNPGGLTTVRQATFSVGHPTVAGTVTLQDLRSPAVPGQVVRVLVREPGTTTLVQTVDVTLGTAGAFTFQAPRAGTFDLAFQGSRWLRRSVPGVAVTSAGASVSTSLVNGDIDGNNRVDGIDYLRLAQSFRRSSGQAGFNPAADLNGDNRVDGLDYLILARNFRRVGDP